MGKMSLTSCRALSTPGKFSNVDRYVHHLTGKGPINHTDYEDNLMMMKCQFTHPEETINLWQVTGRRDYNMGLTLLGFSYGAVSILLLVKLVQNKFYITFNASPDTKFYRNLSYICLGYGAKNLSQ